MFCRGKKLVHLAQMKCDTDKDEINENSVSSPDLEKIAPDMMEEPTPERQSQNTITALLSSIVDYDDDSDRDKTYVPESESESSEEEKIRKQRITTKVPHDVHIEHILESVSANTLGSTSLEDNVLPFSVRRSNARSSSSQRPWARALRKERKVLLNTGQTYVNVSGKEVQARKIKPLKQCKKKCFLILENDIRKTIFSEYWGLGTHDKRVAFIAKHVTSKDVKCRRPRQEDGPKKRNVTHEYCFEIKGQRKSVCKHCFLSTLDEHEKFVKHAMKNKIITTTGTPPSDRRGKHTPKHKKTEEEINEVRAHILSFPSYESHYTRRSNDKKYLPSHLNLQIMYKLYAESKTKPVSRKIYEREFHVLNLSFKKPSVDTCHKCDVLHMKLKVANEAGNEEERERTTLELKLHQEAADFAYASKAKDKEICKKESSKKCFSFDLQQCLPTPCLGSSVAFYKRQLWTFNLTVHDNGTGQSTNYMWHEAMAGRGASEIASCLYMHIFNMPPNVSEITFYSDTCGGQNKNSHVAAMFIKAMIDFPHIKVINHKFLIAGHTHMECDIDHSMIEKRKKKSEFPIYHPHDWYQLVRSTGKKQEFHVVELDQHKFYDFAGLLKSSLVSRKKNTEGEPFSWHDVQWLQYTQDEGVVNYKNSLSDETFKVLSFKRRGNSSIGQLQKKYKSLIPISTEKKKDILDLLPLIPPVFHDFYRSLPTDPAASTQDPDLIEVELE